MANVSYLTKGHFDQLAVMDRKLKKARGHGFSQFISDIGLTLLKPGELYPVVSTMLHNDAEVRAVVAMNERGAAILCDMPLEFYSALPTTEREERP